MACGQYAQIGACGDIRVNDNVITPYGVTIVDCALAEGVAHDAIEGNRVGVRSGTCSLKGSGVDAIFDCRELADGEDPGRFAGSVVSTGDRPTRDTMNRVPAVVLVAGGGVNRQYQLLLLDAGAAVVSESCLSPTIQETDYCHNLIAHRAQSAEAASRVGESHLARE